MHTHTLHSHWRHRLRTHVSPRPRFRKAVEPNASGREHRSWHSIVDDPRRARLRPVHLLPLIVPAMALLLLICIGLINIAVL
ncbi:MAG TPA: hypothetical protein VIO33_17485 [Burkholderiaceae bacterium]